MRIGLTGGGSSVDKIVQQAQRAEADGFTSLWYSSSVAGDPWHNSSVWETPGASEPRLFGERWHSCKSWSAAADRGSRRR